MAIDHLGQRPDQDGVVYAASGVGGDRHLHPGDRHGHQGKKNRAQGVAARQRRQQQCQAEGVEQQRMTRMSGKCRNLGRCRFQSAVRRCGRLVCQSSRSASRRGRARRRWLPAGGLCRPDRWYPRRYCCGMWPAGCEYCKESAATRRARRQAQRFRRGAASGRGQNCLGNTNRRATPMPPIIHTANALSHIARPSRKHPQARAGSGFDPDKIRTGAASRRQRTEVLQRHRTPIEAGGQQIK